MLDIRPRWAGSPAAPVPRARAGLRDTYADQRQVDIRHCGDGQPAEAVKPDHQQDQKAAMAGTGRRMDQVENSWRHAQPGRHRRKRAGAGNDLFAGLPPRTSRWPLPDQAPRTGRVSTTPFGDHFAPRSPFASARMAAAARSAPRAARSRSSPARTARPAAADRGQARSAHEPQPRHRIDRGRQQPGCW